MRVFPRGGGGDGAGWLARAGLVCRQWRRVVTPPGGWRVVILGRPPGRAAAAAVAAADVGGETVGGRRSLEGPWGGGWDGDLPVTLADATTTDDDDGNGGDDGDDRGVGREGGVPTAVVAPWTGRRRWQRGWGGGGPHATKWGSAPAGPSSSDSDDRDWHAGGVAAPPRPSSGGGGGGGGGDRGNGNSSDNDSGGSHGSVDASGTTAFSTRRGRDSLLPPRSRARRRSRHRAADTVAVAAAAAGLPSARAPRARPPPAPNVRAAVRWVAGSAASARLAGIPPQLRFLSTRLPPGAIDGSRDVNEVDDDALAVLAAALAPSCRLAGLVIGPGRGVRGGTVAALANVAPRLRLLDVTGMSCVKDATLVAVAASCPALATLRVDDTRVALGSGGGVDRGKRGAARVLEPLASVLTELSARHTSLRVVPFVALRGFTRLTVLRIDRAWGVHREVVAPPPTPTAVVLPDGGSGGDGAGAADAVAAFPALVTLSATGSTRAGVRGLVPILRGAPRLAAFAVSEVDSDSVPPIRFEAGPAANRLAGLVTALHPAAPLAVLHLRGMGVDDAALTAVAARAGTTLTDLRLTHTLHLGRSGRGGSDIATWAAAGAALRVLNILDLSWTAVGLSALTAFVGAHDDRGGGGIRRGTLTTLTVEGCRGVPRDRRRGVLGHLRGLAGLSPLPVG